MLERAINFAVTRARADSSRARDLLTALAGHRVALVVEGTPLACSIESSGTGLACQWLDPATPQSPRDSAAPEAAIHGTPLALLALTGSDPEAAIRRGDVRIEGDTAIAQQWRELLLLLRPDLEHVLSGLIGRSAAHLMMRALRGAADWGRDAAWTGVQNVSEYLAHERRDLVSRAEAEHFLRGVDELREQLDRIDARMAALEQKL